MSHETKNRDIIRRSVRRFCRTDEAADNLTDYIVFLTDLARVDELGNLGPHRKIISRKNGVELRAVFTDVIDARIVQLTKSETPHHG